MPAATFGVEERRDDFRREDWRDRIAANAPEIHSSGKPINQKGNAGFGAPRFAVEGADDPLVVSPPRAIATICV
jgi:hypothetical protein